MISAIPRPAVKRVNKIVVLPKTNYRQSQKPTKRRVITPAILTPRGPITPRGVAGKPQINLPVRPAVARSKPSLTRNVQHRVIEWKGNKSRRESIDITSTPRNITAIHDLKGQGRGKILVIVGNGPSINDVDLSPLKAIPHIDIISINKPVANIWPTEYWLFCDVSQYKRHHDLWDNYEGVIINTKAVPNQKPKCVKLKSMHGKGFSYNLLDGVHVGRSSVYVAMQVALWMGYDSIYIFGIDMSVLWKDGVMITHFFGTNPDVKPDIRASRFDEEAKHYDHASSILSNEDRQKFTFCSSMNPYGFVNKFKRLDHKVAVSNILDVVASKY